MLGKYNPTVLRLKEKVTQGIGPLTLETSLELISLYEKCYNVCDKSKKKRNSQRFLSYLSTKCH